MNLKPCKGIRLILNEIWKDLSPESIRAWANGFSTQAFNLRFKKALIKIKIDFMHVAASGLCLGLRLGQSNDYC